MIVIYEIKTFVAQFAMLFFSTFVSKKAFPIFSFVIGINLGVIMTYLYVSSRFADSILGSSHNTQNINFEQVQDLEKSEDLNQHQSKLLHTYFKLSMIRPGRSRLLETGNKR